MSDTAPQFDPEARVYIREAVAYLRRLSRTHKCSGRYCGHCVITNNLDKARRFLWPADPLGEVDPDSPYAGCPGSRNDTSRIEKP